MQINQTRGLIIISIIALAVLLIFLYVERSTMVSFVDISIIKKILPIWEVPVVTQEPTVTPPAGISGVAKFASESEFKKYLQAGSELLSAYGGFGFSRGVSTMALESVSAPMVSGTKAEDVGQTAERVSETNVQVLGIDEPDIVKTNGKEIFFSRETPVYRIMAEPQGERTIMPPFYEQKSETKIITAFPPENLALKNKIEQGGDLLLEDNVLAILSGDQIYGFDISDIKSPKEAWKIEIEDNNYVVSSRLYKNRLYVVLSQYINEYKPCPLRPLSVNGEALEIRCVDIYHPAQLVPADIVYTALIINPDSGVIEKNISFVGYSGSSMVYMSPQSLYITYSYNADFFPILVKFFTSELRDFFPESFISRIEKLEKYDIGSQAKLTEFITLLESYDNSLTNDDRLKLENEIQNRSDDYFKKQIRELEFTGIIKISLDDFNVKATGRVPGRPLNQFSLDEYENHLRIATTISGGGFWFGFGGFSESANDVYVLDSNLGLTGLVTDMGLTERIYSVRFLADRGYVVTFRQTDPFYVLDLSDHKKPEIRGQLKIPGYSSYLHPLESDKILGIGKEGSYVKISLFDVSSAEAPKEISKYTLQEYWSEILNTHHAFLQDKKHNIFFMPGSRGGYIFSYENNEIKMKKAVSNITPSRALYLNDYLYILADNKIVVLNENNWETVKTLELTD